MQSDFMLSKVTQTSLQLLIILSKKSNIAKVEYKNWIQTQEVEKRSC